MDVRVTMDASENDVKPALSGISSSKCTQIILTSNKDF